MNRRNRAKVAADLSHIERAQVTANSGPSELQMNDAYTKHDNPAVIRDALERLSLVVAPPTLVIALAYWFGWTETNARSKYFGIDASTLGYSTTDYLLRSADASFVPVAVILLASLAMIMLHGFVQHALKAGWGLTVVRRGAKSAAVLGALLSFFGVWAMFKPLPLITNYLIPPVILDGPPLIAYSAWTLRHIRSLGRKREDYVIPAWERIGYTVATLLALLGLFWASSLYASALGRGRAEVLAANLSGQPAVTVFSMRSLSISRLASVLPSLDWRLSIQIPVLRSCDILIQSAISIS